MTKLTDKQKKFIDEYLVDLNATQAAIRAGYKEKAAYRTGAENLRKPQIQEEIQKRMEERQKRTEITQDMVLQELAAIAFARATDYVSVRDGMVQVKDTDQLSDSQIAAIAGIKETQNGIEVKLGSKEKTLELLGRHLGMWNDKINVEGQVEAKNPFADLTTEELKKLVGDG
jgi:phage terminase small subunit